MERFSMTIKSILALLKKLFILKVWGLWVLQLGWDTEGVTQLNKFGNRWDRL